jgi:hypothetical protein
MALHGVKKVQSRHTFRVADPCIAIARRGMAAVIPDCTARVAGMAKLRRNVACETGLTRPN